jgi:signal transduction histidine kinase/CheY-like chemotaxis protein
MTTDIKNKELQVTTYSKVITVLTIVTIGFLILFSILFYHSYQQYKLVSKISTTQFESEANALVELNSEGYSSLIKEITFWDELVSFVEKKDLAWFNNSLAYLVDTNKIDYIDAYTIDGQFVTKVATSKIKSFNFIPKGVFQKLNKEKTIRFYLKIPEGIVEVYGATVHPSQDPFKNKTQPKGYLFISKLLDASYFVNLEKVIGSKIDYSTKTYQSNDRTIFFNKIIRDFEGKEITSLTFARQNAVSFSRTRNLLIILLFSFIASILVFLFYAQKWAKRPLSLIKEVLETGNADAIGSLKRIRGEFSYIGKLFEENSNQKLELKLAKTKAEESDTLKSSFLMNLSHEIRTPMNAIVGFSDLLLNPKITSSERSEYVKIIQNSGKNLIEIIDDLVEMSRIDSKLIQANRTSFNLEKIINTVKDSISIVNQNKTIDIKILHPENQLQKNIVSDVVKLNQVLINLMNNALKFTNEGFVMLDYDIDTKNNKIIFAIKDSGIGISEDYQAKIFDRFTKIDLKQNTTNDGLGLGLSIAKSYVELLGGTIKLQSQVGVGSTFTFDIPLVLDESIYESDLNKNSEIIDLGNEEIVLVAEDDLINFKLLQKLLSNFKIKILHAKDGLEAVTLCKQNSEIDLIFMDIKMPNLDGYGAFEQIRAFNTKVPIVAHTSYSFKEELEKIQQMGFDDCILKPLDKQKVFEIMNKYFSK